MTPHLYEPSKAVIGACDQELPQCKLFLALWKVKESNSACKYNSIYNLTAQTLVFNDGPRLQTNMTLAWSNYYSNASRGSWQKMALYNFLQPLLLSLTFKKVLYSLCGE